MKLRCSHRSMPLPILLVALAIPSLSATKDAFAVAGSQGAKLRSVVAGVTVREFPGGPARPASTDTVLRTGMVIGCGDMPTELVYADGTTIHLEPHSAVQLQYPTDAVLSLGAATRVSRLDLRTGSIRVLVGRGSRPILVLGGRDEFAVFRSGAGRVMMNADGMTTLVEEGAGMLASGGRWSAVPAGHYLTIGRRSSGLQPLFPPPVLSRERCEATETQACAIAVTASDAKARVAARWNPLPAGQRPVISLAADPSGSNVIAAQTLAEGASEFSAELSAGSYWLTVRAVGADGIEGQPATFPLRVVRLVPDSDTVVRDGRAVIIPSGHSLRIEDSAGITIEEPGRIAVQERGAVALRSAERRRALRLALASEPSHFTWFTLHLRERSADVAISPGAAIWPRDPLTVSIELRDNAGIVSEPQEPPNVQLDVNGVAEQLELSRSGSRWVGQIAPRRGGGPWTVRAGVFDHEGNRIGHGVLHVISQRDALSAERADLSTAWARYVATPHH